MLTKPFHCGTYIFVISLFGVGCSQPAEESGPSYSDLVVTYNAELASLDRLEAKREKLLAEYVAAVRPASDALEHLESLLGSARELVDGDKTDVDAEAADPNALLDQLASRSESTEEIANQLVDGLLGGSAGADAAKELTPEQTAELAAVKEKFEAEIAALDQEIAEQKARVDRARAVRDAVEAKS